MPNDVNLYEPRSMAGAHNKRMPVTTFLRDRFLSGVKTYPTENVDVDFRKGTQAIAPFVAKNVGGINVERIGFTTKTYTPPRVAPERPISKDVLQPRVPGETIHTSMSPEDRQDYYLEQDAQELDDMISRREELMIAELMTTGIINVRGYTDENKTQYIDDNINFSFSNKITCVDNERWSQSTSKKLEDLEEACEMVLQAGCNPQHAILGKDSWNKLKADTNFQKFFDVRKFDFGNIAPQLNLVNGNGVKFIGYISELGLYLWQYLAWYLNESGELTPYIPNDHIVVAPEGIGEMLYGAITQLEEDKRYHTYEGSRVPKVIADVNNDIMKYRLSARPLPRPFDVDAWAVIDTDGGTTAESGGGTT
jgi:hypothetical protein